VPPIRGFFLGLPLFEVALSSEVEPSLRGLPLLRDSLATEPPAESDVPVLLGTGAVSTATDDGAKFYAKITLYEAYLAS
jgi:hypothetical protein